MYRETGSTCDRAPRAEKARSVLPLASEITGRASEQDLTRRGDHRGVVVGPALAEHVRRRVEGIVDDDAQPFGEESQPPGKVATLIAFCVVDSAPVAFFDAMAITPSVG